MLIGAMLATTACATMGRGGKSSEDSYSLVINNRSHLEVVVSAVPAPGALGARLANARSFATTTVSVPQSALQGSNGMVVRLHPVGQATAARDWISPRVTMDNTVTARLDIRADSYGGLGMTAFYTVRSTDQRTP